MDNFDEAKIEFEPETPAESIWALAKTVPGVMASALEDETSLTGKLLQVQQVFTADAKQDSLLRVDYEFWTAPVQFDAGNPERVHFLWHQ